MVSWKQVAGAGAGTLLTVPYIVNEALNAAKKINTLGAAARNLKSIGSSFGVLPKKEMPKYTRKSYKRSSSGGYVKKAKRRRSAKKKNTKKYNSRGGTRSGFKKGRTINERSASSKLKIGKMFCKKVLECVKKTPPMGTYIKRYCGRIAKIIATNGQIMDANLYYIDTDTVPNPDEYPQTLLKWATVPVAGLFQFFDWFSVADAAAVLFNGKTVTPDVYNLTGNFTPGRYKVEVIRQTATLSFRNNTQIRKVIHFYECKPKQQSTSGTAFDSFNSALSGSDQNLSGVTSSTYGVRPNDWAQFTKDWSIVETTISLAAGQSQSIRMVGPSKVYDFQSEADVFPVFTKGHGVSCFYVVKNSEVFQGTNSSPYMVGHPANTNLPSLAVQIPCVTCDVEVTFKIACPEFAEDSQRYQKTAYNLYAFDNQLTVNNVIQVVDPIGPESVITDAKI